MLSNSFKCRKNTQIKISEVVKNKKRKKNAFLCSVYNSKNSQLLKEQEAKGLLSILGVNTPFSQIKSSFYRKVLNE